MSAACTGVSAVATSNELVTAPAIARAFIAVSPLTRRCGHGRHDAFELLANSHERARMQTAGTRYQRSPWRNRRSTRRRAKRTLLQPRNAASIEERPGGGTRE